MCPDIRRGCFQPEYLICSCLITDKLSEGHVSMTALVTGSEDEGSQGGVQHGTGYHLVAASTLAYLDSIGSQESGQWRNPTVSFLPTGSHRDGREEAIGWNWPNHNCSFWLWKVAFQIGWSAQVSLLCFPSIPFLSFPLPSPPEALHFFSLTFSISHPVSLEPPEPSSQYREDFKEK